MNLSMAKVPAQLDGKAVLGGEKGFIQYFAKKASSNNKRSNGSERNSFAGEKNWKIF